MPNLVGIGLSQVPTNSMLGGLAYQDPEHASIKDLDLKNLSQINSEIADTAVDIFIYDTSKDSDGGAWRKRTSHTSWYNETLGTTTRGTRREFPAVAVIVAETGQVTIYDGDDPDLPMWMVFNGTAGSASHNLLVNTGTFCLSALNGTVFMGALAIYVNFISEYSRGHRSSSGSLYWNGPYKGNIAERNAGKGSTQLGDKLINGASNDVAMTVLPNAPIDDATGLPVPTIAVATGDGVSIIKDDGTVIDYTHQNATYDATSFVEFLGDDRVAYAWDSDNTPRRLYVTPVRATDTATVDPSSYPRDTVDTVGYGRPTDNKDVGNYHGHLIGDDQSVAAAMNGSMIAVGDGSDGLNLVDVQAAGDDTFNSLVAFATTSYNTGWQYGNIKGTFLSDTDDTNLSTSDLGLITNGDFSNGTTGWSNDATEIFTVSGGGVASVDRNGGSAQGQCYQTITTEVGRTYTVSVLVSALSHGFQVYAGEAPSASNITMSQGAINSTGTHYWTFTATTTSTRLDFSAVQNVNGTASFDNITIFDGVADRSVNRKGLAVYGTVTKSAVATGADLVAYSGFSASNHLAQPYNSDLDPGSGSYSVVAWFKTESNNSGSGAITGLGNNDGDEVMILYVASTYGIYFDYGSGSEYVYLSNSNDRSMVRDGNWHQVVCQVTAGQVGEIYIDGIKKTTAQNVAAPGTWSQWDTNYRLYVGCARGLGTLPFSGSISLVRYSLSKMSTEQIKKMYEDEKFLFQENAACTLYGSSDAVTALAYDESTEQLHVGTSSGRSDFQELRRINNTTTAVTTAISAHDEFIIEQ